MGNRTHLIHGKKDMKFGRDLVDSMLNTLYASDNIFCNCLANSKAWSGVFKDLARMLLLINWIT